MPSAVRLFAVTVDCPEPAVLARFYQGFLGGQTFSSNDDFVALVIEGDVRLDFQRVPNPEPPRWPAPSAARRVHLDFAVEDMAGEEQRLVALGAKVADGQPGGRRFRVLIDPAGHPLCLANKATAYLGRDHLG
jgi:hypothetical protein